MRVTSAIASVQRNTRNHGAQAALFDLAVRALNRCVYVKSLTCVVLEQAAPGSLTLPPHLEHVRLDPARLSSYSHDKENELSAQFVRDALARGDECHAVLNGNSLASYGWYSTQPTPVDRDLRIHFDSGYVYMYKGFTAYKYRGQRLHAIGMMLALNTYRDQGFKGLLSYVESNNYDSLKSCRRLGYKTCGSLRVIGLAGRYLVQHGQGCSDYGLDLQSNDRAITPFS